MIYKVIVCLANSRKWRGKCVAGREINNYNWIRPVSGTDKGELINEQMAYDDGRIPEVLDIIRIPISRWKAEFYQPENILISRAKWEKVGEYPENKLDDLCDRPQTLWTNDYPSQDRISLDYLEKNKIKSSLLLIKPKSVKIKCEERTDDYGQRKKALRASFTYNQKKYDLRITDPIIENRYKKRGVGTYPLTSGRIYMCISLGGPYEEHCYKLIASIICVDAPISSTSGQSLCDALREWRLAQATKEGVPAFCIAHDSYLKDIINSRVKTKEDLSQVKGFGKKRIEKYGDEIIKVVTSFVGEYNEK